MLVDIDAGGDQALDQFVAAVVAGQPQGIAAVGIEGIEVDAQRQQFVDDVGRPSLAARMSAARQRAQQEREAARMSGVKRPSACGALISLD